jgi:hypothetical protein
MQRDKHSFLIQSVSDKTKLTQPKWSPMVLHEEHRKGFTWVRPVLFYRWNFGLRMSACPCACLAHKHVYDEHTHTKLLQQQALSVEKKFHNNDTWCWCYHCLSFWYLCQRCRSRFGWHRWRYWWCQCYSWCRCCTSVASECKSMSSASQFSTWSGWQSPFKNKKNLQKHRKVLWIILFSLAKSAKVLR